MAELLTVKEIAGYLKFNKMTVYRLAREGRIPASKTGRRWLFNKESIDNLLLGQDKEAVKTQANLKG